MAPHQKHVQTIGTPFWASKQGGTPRLLGSYYPDLHSLREKYKRTRVQKCKLSSIDLLRQNCFFAVSDGQRTTSQLKLYIVACVPL